jgi:hypothetical protein
MIGHLCQRSAGKESFSSGPFDSSATKANSHFALAAIDTLEHAMPLDS